MVRLIFTFLILSLTNVYGLNIENDSDIFLYKDKGVTTSGRIINSGTRDVRFEFDIEGTNFKLEYNQSNKRKPWKVIGSYGISNAEIEDVFNTTLYFDHTMNNTINSVGQKHYPPIFANRTPNTMINYMGDLGGLSRSEAQKFLSGALKAMNNKLEFRGQQCFKGRNVYKFTSAGNANETIRSILINFKSNNTFYLDKSTGLISSYGKIQLNGGGETENINADITFTFLADNCGPNSGKINKNVESKYISAYGKDQLYASLSKNKQSFVANSTVGNLYCQNTTTKRVYETSRSSCVGIDKSISESDYNIILASQNSQSSTYKKLNESLTEVGIDLELELDKKLPDWHFNKNEDYYILGFDKYGNKLVGSAKLFNRNTQNPKSAGDYFYLKSTYEKTLNKSCRFESEANTNYMKNSVLVARGKVILDCDGERKLGRWEQKGNTGFFITNDKSIYGFFKGSKFDYLGAYLLPNSYSQNTANDIYNYVRTSKFENPYDLYNPIAKKIKNSSDDYFFQNSEDILLASEEQQRYSQYKKFCKNSKNGYVTAYKFDLECNPGWVRASLNEYIEYINKNSSQQDDFEIVLKKKPEKHTFHVSTVLNDLETALENNSSPQSEIISAEELLRESKQALAAIDNLKALNLLNKIINLNEVPKEILAETYYLLGRVNYIEQNEIEAVKNFAIRHRDFKDIDNYKTSNYYWLGRALFAIGDSENGCLVMEDIIFSKEFKNSYSYINDAQLTAKDQNCGLIFKESPKSYQVSNDLDDILNNLQGFENKANLNKSSPITSSEIDVLRTQLYSCLTLTAGGSNLKDLKPVINIKVNRDRTVRRAVVVNKDRLNQPSFRAAAEAAMRAINNPDCSPLLLPPDKYDQWKEINFTFDFSWMYDDDTYTATNNQVLYVNASSLNVRKSPNGSVILGSLGRNTLLEVLETQLNWTKVRDNSSGLVGWVSNEYLSENLSEFETETIVASNEVENMEEALPQKQNKEIKLEVKEKENDFDAPDIKCIQDLKTQESFVDINCEIYDKNNLFAVVVDNESISPENKFSHKVQVSIGTSTILVQAYDEYGNVGQFDINVEREFNLAIKEKTLEKLLPGKISVPNKINRLAVVIGIRDYKDISDTKYADKDALTFIDYASNNLGIMPENIKYLIDDSASNFDMEEVNIWLAKKVDKNTEVFLYYSGHGFNNNGEALLLPFDFRTSLIEQSSIKKDKFIQDILLLNPEHIYAFFDACFSGLGREGEALIAGLRNISIVEEKSIDNVTIFNSSSGSEFSSDFDKAGHGLFSYYLMKGLEGDADGNNDQKITTSELYTFIEDNVSKTSGLKQNPSLLSSQDKVILQW